MSKTVAALAILAALGGCKPDAPGAPRTPAPPSSSAATAPAPPAPPSPPSAPPRPGAPPQLAPPPGIPPQLEPVPIDDAIVGRFVSFDKKYLATLPRRMQVMRDELRKLEQASRLQGAAGASTAAGIAEGVLKRMQAQDDKLRAEAGITPAQAQTVQELSIFLAAVKAKKADLADARKKFGEVSVAVALRHEQDLVALADAHMKVFQDAMKLMGR